MGLFPSESEEGEWEENKNRRERHLSILGQHLLSAAVDVCSRLELHGPGIPLVPHQEKEKSSIYIKKKGSKNPALTKFKQNISLVISFSWYCQGHGEQGGCQGHMGCR